MSRASVFTSIGRYIFGVYDGLRSLFRALAAALPYLLKVTSGERRKAVTEQYPDPVSSRRPDDLPSRSRGILVNDIERCVGCGDCEKVCPVACITVETEQGAEAAKTWISVFDIDMARCLFCGLCVEVCGPNSLVHTREYEAASPRVDAMLVSFGRGRVTQEQRAKWAAMRRANALDEGVLS